MNPSSASDDRWPSAVICLTEATEARVTGLPPGNSAASGYTGCNCFLSSSVNPGLATEYTETEYTATQYKAAEYTVSEYTTIECSVNEYTSGEYTTTEYTDGE